MRAASVVRARRRQLVVVALLLLALWGLPALLPEAWGLAFGPAYRLFFSAFVVAGALFLELLGTAAPAAPASTPRVLGSIVLVYVVTVGGLVAVAQLYPQFEAPRLAPGQTALPPEERGKAIFWDRTVACFACHAIAGVGGKRAPDLAGVGTRAATRKAGVPAEEYIRNHIRQGSQYGAVPGYAPIMPPFDQRIPATQIEDLVQFLLSLR